MCDKETYDYLRTVAPDVHVVRGDYDEVHISYVLKYARISAQVGMQDPRFPLSLTITHPPLRIGVVHGHLNVPVGELDSLGAVARQMDVDVLISGHTHKLEGLSLCSSTLSIGLSFPDSKRSNIKAVSS